MWEIVLIDEVRAWYDDLDSEADTAVAAAIDNLEMFGPQLGRPLVDRVKGSTEHDMKELRPPRREYPHPVHLRPTAASGPTGCRR